MKTYRIYVHTGDYAMLEAKDENDLVRKLSTGAYGVVPLRGREFTRFTPYTVKEIIEESSKN